MNFAKHNKLNNITDFSTFWILKLKVFKFCKVVHVILRNEFSLDPNVAHLPVLTDCLQNHWIIIVKLKLKFKCNFKLKSNSNYI